MDKDQIIDALKKKNSTHLRDDGVRKLSWRIIASFALSTILNYVLASKIVTSPAGTEEFNQEVGRLTGLSYPVIAIPATLIMIV